MGRITVSELHKFLFDGLPVRGAIVRLTDAWQEILQRRAVNTSTGPYPLPVQEMLGEMTAAGVLMQSNIKFNGALVFQISGDGPVKLAVTEVLTNLSVRSTVTMIGDLPADATLTDMVNVHGKGRCAITLDPKDKQPGQQPYQGVVPLVDVDGQPLESIAAILQQYMRQSEQLDTVLVLAANTLLRPLVNAINRKPLDVASTEMTNAVFVVAERLHQRLALAMLQDVLERGGYPPGDIDIQPFGDAEVVIEATLAAQSVEGEELDAMVQQLAAKPGVRQAFWSPSTRD